MTEQVGMAATKEDDMGSWRLDVVLVKRWTYNRNLNDEEEMTVIGEDVVMLAVRAMVRIKELMHGL